MPERRVSYLLYSGDLPGGSPKALVARPSTPDLPDHAPRPPSFLLHPRESVTGWTRIRTDGDRYEQPVLVDPRHGRVNLFTVGVRHDRPETPLSPLYDDAPSPDAIAAKVIRQLLARGLILDDPAPVGETRQELDGRRLPLLNVVPAVDARAPRRRTEAAHAWL